MFLVTGPEPLDQWGYTILDYRDVYDREDRIRSGDDGRLRISLEANARKWFRKMHPGVPIVSEVWREVPSSDQEWKELINA